MGSISHVSTQVAGEISGAISEQVSAQENSLYCWGILDERQLSQPRRLGVTEGLFLETPTRLELLQLAGQDYALVADQNSSVILHGTSLSAIHDDMLLF